MPTWEAAIAAINAALRISQAVLDVGPGIRRVFRKKREEKPSIILPEQKGEISQTRSFSELMKRGERKVSDEFDDTIRRKRTIADAKRERSGNGRRSWHRRTEDKERYEQEQRERRREEIRKWVLILIVVYTMLFGGDAEGVIAIVKGVFGV